MRSLTPERARASDLLHQRRQAARVDRRGLLLDLLAITRRKPRASSSSPVNVCLSVPHRACDRPRNSAAHSTDRIRGRERHAGARGLAADRAAETAAHPASSPPAACAELLEILAGEPDAERAMKSLA